MTRLLRNDTQEAVNIGGLTLPAGAVVILEESIADRVRRRWPEFTTVQREDVPLGETVFFVEGQHVQGL